MRIADVGNTKLLAVGACYACTRFQGAKVPEASLRGNRVDTHEPRTVRFADALPTPPAWSVIVSVSVHVRAYNTPVMGMRAPLPPVVQSTVLPVALAL